MLPLCDITKRKKVVEETTWQATVEEWPQGELPHKKDGGACWTLWKELLGSIEILGVA